MAYRITRVEILIYWISAEAG